MAPAKQHCRTLLHTVGQRACRSWHRHTQTSQCRWCGANTRIRAPTY